MDCETASFSIDHELCEAEGERPRVRCVFVVGEDLLGEPEASIEVPALQGAIEVVARHEGSRRDDALFALPLERLFRTLEIGQYVYADPGLDAGSDWHRYLRFVAAPRELPAFAGWTIFLVENGQLGRLVWRRPGWPSPEQAFVEAGALDAALKELQIELEAALSARRSVVPVSGERAKGKLRDVG